MKYHIDETQFSALAICLECDWRGMATDRLTALTRIAKHEEFVHPATRNCRNALAQTRWRNTHPANTHPPTRTR